MIAPQERNAPCVLRVRQPSFWPNADALALGADVYAARQILAKPRVVQHFGQAIGQAHRSSMKFNGPMTDLKTRVEAEHCWRDIAQSAVLSAMSPLVPQAALVAVQRLGDQLWESTPERIEMVYHFVPGALSVRADGRIVGRPKTTATGFHAWFEPLARLDFAAHTERDQLALMVDAYAGARADVPNTNKETWQRDALRCRVLFDLLYVGHLVSLIPAPAAPSGQTLRQGYQSIESLAELLPRLRSDLQALQSVDPSAPPLVAVSQPHLRERTDAAA